jgi:hypothetical protein
VAAMTPAAPTKTLRNLLIGRRRFPQPGGQYGREPLAGGSDHGVVLRGSRNERDRDESPRICHIESHELVGRLSS